MDTLLGGIISLVSIAAGIILQHLLSLGKQKAEARQYPAKVLYDKQVEFYGKLLNALSEVNGYITSIDVWLQEEERGDPEAEAKLAECARKTHRYWPLHELIETYYIYLPNIILEKTNELFFECSTLSEEPSSAQTEKCLNLLFSLMNTSRKCIGVDAVAEDLFKALYGAARIS